jgi:hypothetical protein
MLAFHDLNTLSNYFTQHYLVQHPGIVSENFPCIMPLDRLCLSLGILIPLVLNECLNHTLNRMGASCVQQGHHWYSQLG